MSNNIEVHECGTVAETRLGHIPCIVTGISIRSTRITYEMSWFADGKHQSEWMEECEINFKEDKKVRIGYKSRT